MEYRFYGWQTPDVKPIDPEWSKVKNQRHLYDLLLDCWTVETCAPMFRPEWSEKNPTLGQCTITAFLVQDIFGGEVYGIPLPGGIVHCYNVVDGIIFDLTSEQFGRKVLEYALENPQSREIKFARTMAKSRYELLKENLKKRLEME